MPRTTPDPGAVEARRRTGWPMLRLWPGALAVLLLPTLLLLDLTTVDPTRTPKLGAWLSALLFLGIVTALSAMSDLHARDAAERTRRAAMGGTAMRAMLERDLLEHEYERAVASIREVDPGMANALLRKLASQWDQLHTGAFPVHPVLHTDAEDVLTGTGLRTSLLPPVDGADTADAPEDYRRSGAAG